MGAVKAMAIELEIHQDQAAALGDAATAFRLGMLEACRLIGEVGNRHIGSYDGDPFLAVNDCWRAVFEAANYLREVSDL
jgi:hypothetical protein